MPLVPNCKWSIAAAPPALGQPIYCRSPEFPTNPTTCELHRLAWSLHYRIAGTHMALENNNKRLGRTPRSPLKIFLYRTCLALWLQATLFSVAWAQAPEPDSSAPLLTLDEAIRIATGANREIQISKFEIFKAKEIVVQAKTNYLPRLDANVLAGAPLQPLNFTVPAGSLGTYPATGPIPGKDSN